MSTAKNLYVCSATTALSEYSECTQLKISWFATVAFVTFLCFAFLTQSLSLATGSLLKKMSLKESPGYEFS